MSLDVFVTLNMHVLRVVIYDSRVRYNDRKVLRYKIGHRNTYTMFVYVLLDKSEGPTNLTSMLKSVRTHQLLLPIVHQSFSAT